MSDNATTEAAVKTEMPPPPTPSPITIPSVDLDTADFSPEAASRESVTEQDGSPAPAATTAPPEELPVTKQEESPTPDQSPATETPPLAEQPPPEASKPSPDATVPDDKAVETRQNIIRRFQNDYAAFQKKITDGSFDAIEDGTAAFKTLAKGLELLNEELGNVRQQTAVHSQQTTAQRFWSDFDAANPNVGAKQGQALFQAEVAAMSRRGLKGDALQAAATISWEAKIAAMKNAVAPPKTTPQSPPVTIGAARVTPVSGTTPPKPKPKNIDDKVEAGEYGNFRDELDL